jgi:hypothetical protein
MISPNETGGRKAEGLKNYRLARGGWAAEKDGSLEAFRMEGGA